MSSWFLTELTSYRNGMQECLRVGIFGLGTVGTGVVELMQQNQELIAKRVGKPVQITKIVVANPHKPRKVDVSAFELSADPASILHDPQIDIVVELMGGLGLAETVILEALQSGKSVVTANKALLAEKARSIFPVAYRASGYFGFEASVGAGIPIIRALREGFSGDEIQEISGILNGTANYILTQMTQTGLGFDEALQQAQNLGYAEPDPRFDIEGIDTAHKLLLLMNLAFNGIFEFHDLYKEGITCITATDIRYAQELGYTIKLVGQARRTPQGIEGRVHPVLLPNAHTLAGVQGAFNAISVIGNFVGPCMLHGLGAGAHPTAAGVVADIIEACRFRLTGQQTPLSPFSVSQEHVEPLPIVPIQQLRTQYYLRFHVLDQVGVLAQIAQILSVHQISIRSVIQKGEAQGTTTPVAVIIVTHQAVEQHVQKALQQIAHFPFVTESPLLIRMAAERFVV